MKYTAIALVATAGMAAVSAGGTRQCTGKAYEEGGNWFCGRVGHIRYEGLGVSGTYQAITGMSSTGECQRATKQFSGPLAPLNEGLSLHFRGPLQLKEMAVYTLARKSKREEEHVEEAETVHHAHGHRHIHAARRKERKEDNERRADWVTATINGKVVSWVNNWNGQAPATQAPPPAGAAAAAPTAAAPAPAPAPAPASKDKPAASGQDWDRTSYYNANTQQAENLVFLGNYGGQGSGVFDTTWGNSLAFLNAQGTGGAATSQVLQDVYIPTNKEFSIFSGQLCDDSCGFSRAPDVAYKGFEGAHKIFLFNFKMPMDGLRGFNGDLPAIWALNAAIPRTAQYNNCSCWPDCGEFDFFEVLRSGDDKCKSTIHLAVGKGGGSSDYFARPTNDYVKGAAIFDGDSGAVSVRILPADTNFAKGLDAATVTGWVSRTSQGKASGGGGSVEDLLTSLFQLAG